MSVSTDVRARWSAAAKCPKWAALGARHATAGEPSDQTRRYWIRGKALGRYVADCLAEEYGEENIIREKPVAWPCGVLHADVFIKTTGTPVEIKSTDHPESLIDDALLQLAGEVYYDPDAHGRGVLELVSPTSYERTPVPFTLTEEWKARVEQVTQEVLMGATSTEGWLPDCTASDPTGCRFKGCPFTEQAWADWEPPAATELDADDEVRAEVARMYRVEQAIRQAKADVSALEASRAIARARLSPLLQPGREYRVGPLTVKRIEVAGRETYKTALAVKAGAINPAVIEEFKSIGKPSERWYLQRVSDEPLPQENFGEDLPF